MAGNMLKTNFGGNAWNYAQLYYDETISSIWLNAPCCWLRGMWYNMHCWLHCLPLKLTLKPTSDDIYICTLLMNILHICQYMLVLDVIIVVACHLIVWNMFSHCGMWFLSLHWDGITTIIVYILITFYVPYYSM